MSDEKKGKVFLISMTVIIVLLFLSQGAYPKYKAGKYNSESIDQIMRKTRKTEVMNHLSG